MYFFRTRILKRKMDYLEGQTKFDRVFLIVMDSVGVGHAADSEKYGDSPKSNTFLNIDSEVSGLLVENLEKM